MIYHPVSIIYRCNLKSPHEDTESGSPDTGGRLPRRCNLKSPHEDTESDGEWLVEAGKKVAT